MAASKKTAKRSKTGKARKARPGKAGSPSKSAKKSSLRKTSAAPRRDAKPKKPKPKKAASPKNRRASAASKKPSPRPAAKAKAVRAPKAPPVRRQRGGHYDPAYARDLLAQSGRPEPEPKSFIERSRTGDDLAEGLAEEFVEEITSGENEGADRQDQVVSEERGGPFVVTTGGQEFAEGTDASNPKGARREPFPKT